MHSVPRKSAPPPGVTLSAWHIGEIRIYRRIPEPSHYACSFVQSMSERRSKWDRPAEPGSAGQNMALETTKSARPGTYDDTHS